LLAISNSANRFGDRLRRRRATWPKDLVEYITDAEHLEMFDIADRSIGAAVKFAEYFDAAGPDWKKDYLARRREK
jgi:hypothetical protein